MPCWERRFVELDIDKVDKDLLSQVCDELGLALPQYTEDGRVFIDQNVDVVKVKQEYAKKAVKKAALKKGWKVQFKGQKITLTR